MLNIEKYKEEIIQDMETVPEDRRICNLGSSNMQLILSDWCFKYKYHEDYPEKVLDMVEILEWLCSEYKEPILDGEEREWLSNVIKPFKKEDIKITLLKQECANLQFLNIDISREFDFETELGFPPFKKGTMYKGMELNKEYTLEELGL